MGAPYAESQELVSFHSVSKGAAGECGFRGAYFHLANIDAAVRANLYKIVSICLRPAVPGMVALGCYINPPRPGDPSFEKHQQERQAVISSLRWRAERIRSALNSMSGITCQPIDGSMYAFPMIALPPRAIAEAKRRGQ